jgi:hypothetical protein
MVASGVLDVWRGSERDDLLYFGLRGCVSQTNNIMIEHKSPASTKLE